MNHTRALAIKLISTFVLLFIILGFFYDMAFWNVLWITLVLGIASYLIGDLLILPRTNNTIATVTDFVLALFLIWIMGENLTIGTSLLTPAWVSAIGVAIFEYFFHKYVSNRVINEARRENDYNRTGNLTYQTEYSEELAPNRNDILDDDREE